MTSTNEFGSVIKQNLLMIIPQKQEISKPIPTQCNQIFVKNFIKPSFKFY